MCATEATLRIARTIDATYLPAGECGDDWDWPSEEEVQELLIDRMVRHHFGCLCLNRKILGWYSEALKRASRCYGFSLCTVVDFPSGCLPLTRRLGELTGAIDVGADEVDVVLPIYAFFGGKIDQVKRDLTLMADIASNPGQGRPPVMLKVILETGYWEKKQLIELVELLNEIPNITYYKTSTGRDPIVPVSEKVDHIETICAHTDRQVKASGGLRSLDDYLALESAGATRFGVSLEAAINIVNEAVDQDF